MGEDWLLQNEKILKKRKPKWITYLWGYIFGIILIAGAIAITIYFDSSNWKNKIGGIEIRYAATIGLILFGLLTILLSELDRRKTTYYVTNQRVRKVKGVFSKKENNIPLNKVTNIKISQGIIERIFGYGDVSIDTAGEDATIILDNLDDPRDIYNTLFEKTKMDKGEESAQ